MERSDLVKSNAIAKGALTETRSAEGGDQRATNDTRVVGKLVEKHDYIQTVHHLIQNKAEQAHKTNNIPKWLGSTPNSCQRMYIEIDTPAHSVSGHGIEVPALQQYSRPADSLVFIHVLLQFWMNR